MPDDFLQPDFADPATSLLYIPIGAGDEEALSPGTFSDDSQNQFNVVNTVGWNFRAHALKLGFDYWRFAPSIRGRRYSKVLTFDDITQLATGIVPSGRVTQVDTFLEPRYQNFSAYFQDVWKTPPRLTLTYGLRWEVNPAPSEANGNVPLTVQGLENSSTATLAPQGTKFYETTYANLSRAWALRISRSAMGAPSSAQASAFSMTPVIRFRGTPFIRGAFLTHASRTTGTNQLSTRSSPRSLSGRSAWSRLTLSCTPTTRGASFLTRCSTALRWSSLFGRANSLSLSYVGSATRRLPRSESLRSAVLQNPDFTQIDAVSDAAYSDYNSLQAQFKRRLSNGLQTLLSCTWSKSLDTASDESISDFQTPIYRVIRPMTAGRRPTLSPARSAMRFRRPRHTRRWARSLADSRPIQSFA